MAYGILACAAAIFSVSSVNHPRVLFRQSLLWFEYNTVEIHSRAVEVNDMIYFSPPSANS